MNSVIFDIIYIFGAITNIFVKLFPRFIYSIAIIFIFISFRSPVIIQKVSSQVFTKGEVLEYRAHYGFISAGEGILTVSDKFYLLNGKVCYRVEIKGNSIGAFDRILRIRDVWGSYFDTLNYQPQKSFRSIQEGRYKKREETFFDYQKSIAKVTAEEDTTEFVSVKPAVQDMVSGYYYLRVLDYDRMNKGDTIKLQAIFEDKTYDFKIRYMGKEVVRTRFGKIPSILLKPVMPDNALFSGENSISLWMSDDLNRIPLKVKAQMFVGSVELDLRNYAGTTTTLKKL